MFYKKEGNSIIFNGDGELIYFVPEKFFDINIAEASGDIISLIGVFLYGLYDKSGKLIKLEQFKLPTAFSCRPSSITKEPKYHLKGTKGEADYRLFHFTKGDELICNTRLAKNIDNVDKLTSLLLRANLPESIPYDKIQEYLIKNAEMNGFNYKVSPQILGLLISELCRDPEDLSRPFRLSNMKNMNDYKAISIIKVPKYTSAYTAITSENADEAIAAAMTIKANTHSPLEKVMMENVVDLVPPNHMAL